MLVAAGLRSKLKAGAARRVLFAEGSGKDCNLAALRASSRR